MSLPGLLFHGAMLSDRARNEALAAAVREVVRPGDVVVDVGAGTGLLALLAARAGARRVHALEQGPMARLAALLAARNGLAGVVSVERVRSQEFTPPEPADVVLCETLGYAVLEEGFRHALADARDRMLRPGGRLLPAAVRVLAVPVSTPRLPVDAAYLARIEGLDLEPLGALYRGLWQRRHVPYADELAPGRVALALDGVTLAPGRPLVGDLEFEAARAGTLTAFALWFEADLAGGVVLSSRSPDPANHWAQVVLPAAEAAAVAPGDRIALHLEMDDAEGLDVTWSGAIEPARPGAGVGA